MSVLHHVPQCTQSQLLRRQCLTECLDLSVVGRWAAQKQSQERPISTQVCSIAPCCWSVHVGSRWSDTEREKRAVNSTDTTVRALRERRFHCKRRIRRASRPTIPECEHHITDRRGQPAFCALINSVKVYASEDLPAFPPCQLLFHSDKCFLVLKKTLCFPDVCARRAPGDWPAQHALDTCVNAERKSS